MTNSEKLQSARESFDREVVKFTTEKRLLFRFDGQKKFADKEHNERFAALLKPLTESAQRVSETADAAIEAAATAKAVQHADPLTSLTNDELQRAVNLKPFVQDTVDGLHLAQLAQRLGAVVAIGDKAEIATYHAATLAKVETVRQRANTPGNNATLILAGIADVLPHLETMAGKLVSPAHVKQLAEATALESAAYDVRTATDKQLKELNGEAAQASARFEAMVRSF